MKNWTYLLLIGLLAVAVSLIPLLACEDSEEDDIPPPGTGDDDDADTGEPNCPISDEGLDPLEFIPTCYDPTGENNIITITTVKGTSEEMEEGERYAIVGQFNFPTIGSGKIEPIIGCPGGSNYQKCSYPFNEKSGAFDIRFEVSDCEIIDKPNQITVNVWDAEESVNIALCQIYLGGDIPVDDDTADDDSADDDAVDDDVTDDDAADDDVTDDDTADDDAVDDDTA